jgi:hypothetical protein
MIQLEAPIAATENLSLGVRISILAAALTGPLIAHLVRW